MRRNRLSLVRLFTRFSRHTFRLVNLTEQGAGPRLEAARDTRFLHTLACTFS